MSEKTQLSVEALERIDEVCCQFESALRQNRDQDIRDLLSSAKEAERSSLLRELLVLDIDYKRRRNERVLLADYLEKFSDDSEAVNWAFAQVQQGPPTDKPTSTTLEQIVAKIFDRTTDYHDRERLIEEHPELAEEIRDFLDHRERMQTQLSALQSATSRQLNVRCPNCRASVELEDGTPLSDIHCQSCGSEFNLVESDSRVPEKLQRIGQFQLIKQVGVGQFGTVWKARDLALSRPVAIKIPRNRKMDPTDVEVFLRDARVAAQLNHPNIVSVHEVGKHDDVIYIVSDFIHGAPLDAWTQTRQLSFREIATLIIQIGTAIHYAHEQGVVHRDLKPSNIMMDLLGDPHIVDFGLAKRDIGEVTMTVEGQILGTPAYMSPEQARGDSHQAERGSDIYTLGVILFELLTRERPFRGNRQTILLQILDDAPPRPRKFDAKIPRDLETICLKCLEKHPANRYSTAQAFVDDCQRFLDGKPVVARPVPKVVHAIRWCRRSPVLAGLIATVAVLLTVIAIVSAAGAISTRRALAMADRARAIADQRAEDIEQNFYFSEMNRAGHAAMADDGFAELQRHVLKWLPQEDGTDRRGWEWYYLRSLLNQDLATHHFKETPITVLKWSDDGKFLAAGGADAVIRIVANDGKVRHELHGHTQLIRQIVWHPDLTQIASCGDDGSLCIWSVETGEQLASQEMEGRLLDLTWQEERIIAILLEGAGSNRKAFSLIWDPVTAAIIEKIDLHTRLLESAVLHPNGHLVAVDEYERSLTIRDTANGDEIVAIGQSETKVDHAVWLKGDSQLLYADQSKFEISSWNPQDAPIEPISVPNKAIGGIAVHQKLGYIAFVSGDKEVMIHSMDDESPRAHVLRGHLSPIGAIAFHPKNSLIATGSSDGQLKIWNAKSESDNRVGSAVIRWSPDGLQYVSRLSEQLIIGNRDDEKHVRLDGHRDAIFDVCWSPDATKVASMCYQGEIRVWDVKQQRTIRTIRTSISRSGMRWPRLMTWSPDSQRLAFGHTDQVIRIIDVSDGSVLHEINASCERLNALSWNTAEPFIAAGSSDGHLRWWNTDSGILENELNIGDGVVDVNWSPNGTDLVFACSAGVVVMNIHDRKNWRLLRGHTTYVHTVDWSPDGTRLASGDQNGSVRIWDPKTGQQTIALEYLNGAVCDVAWDPFSKRLAAVTFGGFKTVQFWDSTRNEETEFSW